MKISLHSLRSFFLLVLLITVVSGRQGFAATTRRWVSINDHYWSNASNWSPLGAPQAGDKLVFDSGFQPIVYIDIATPILDRISVNPGCQLSLVAYGASRQITLASDTALSILKGNSSATLGLVTQFSNCFLTLSFARTGNKAIITGHLYVGESCTYNATNSNTLISGSMTNGGNENIGGTIISSTANLSFLAGSGYDNSVFGTAVPVANWDISSTCTLHSQTVTGLGQSFGNFYIDQFNPGDISLKGRLGTVRGNLTLATAYPGTVFIFGTDSSFTMNIGGNLIINDLVYNPPYVYPVHYLRLTDGTASPVINIAGSLIKSNGNRFQIDFGSGGGAATMNVTHDFTNQGNYILRTGGISYGHVNFNGTEQLLTCDSSDHISYTVLNGSHVTLGGTTGSMVLNKTTSIQSGYFTVNGGGKLTCAGLYTIKAIAGGSTSSTFFILSAGGTLESGSPQGITSSGAGSIQTNYRSYSTAANYTYNAGQAQSTGLDAMAVNNLTVNNSTPVTLSNRLSVAGLVTLTYGSNINTSSNAMLIINNGASFPNYGAYVTGPMEKVGNQAFIFPVGSSQTGYTPIGISAPPVATDTFRAQYIHSSAAALGAVTAPGLNHVSPCDYWILVPVNSGSPSVNVTGYWNNYNAACNNITSVSLMALAHLTIGRGGNVWNAYGNNVKTGTTTNGSVTWNNVTIFGDLALGVTNAAARFINTDHPVNNPALPAAWPIPSTGLVHINVQGNDTNPAVSAKISTVSGQLLQTISLLNKTETGIVLPQNGVYFMTLINKDGSVRETKRIVIAH